ncbi:unnamed protein product [marine sediment metagenome]|uniref:Uncharacterized protein n=1 Tax=marine sediment metagenome TaxID=412755 RepID=X1CN06_9ZZZZ
MESGEIKKEPFWLKELTLHFNSGKQYIPTEEDKKFIYNLFLEYRIEGIKPKEAIEKAKNVLMSFKKQYKNKILFYFSFSLVFLFSR